jgi:anaerobic magnesium-protoporphyrin IX monomethyl ester cyclase
LKVFLCQSYLGPETSVARVVFPIGLAYIASRIKGKHEVYCYDPNVADNPEKEYPELLEKTAPDVVGLSLRNVDSAVSSSGNWYYPRFVSMLKTIKKKTPTAKIIVGGAGFSLFAKEIIRRNPEIDFGVMFEGEESFDRLLSDLDHPDRVNNLVFQKNGEVFFTERRDTDFKSSLLPARDLFDVPKYLKKEFSMNVVSKRGCEFNCIFCPNAFLAGYSYRVRSPKSVADEIEIMKKDFDVRTFRFADPTFNCPFQQAKGICQELKNRKVGVAWTADFHAAYINERFMKEAIESNCSWFNFSPDGASDNALAALKKDMTVGHIEKTIALAKKIDGAHVAYGFLYNLPSYNSEHVAGLLRLVPKMMRDLGEKLSGVYFTKIRVYPYSKIYDQAIEEGLITKDTDILRPLYYPGVHTYSMESFALQALKLYYNIQSIRNKLPEKLSA